MKVYGSEGFEYEENSDVFKNIHKLSLDDIYASYQELTNSNKLIDAIAKVYEYERYNCGEGEYKTYIAINSITTKEGITIDFEDMGGDRDEDICDFI